MIPNLKKAIQDTINPTKLAGFLEQIFTTAVEKGTTDDQLKSIDAILKLGYSDEVPVDNSIQNAPLIKSGQKTVLGGAVPQKQLEVFDDTDIIGKEYDLNTEEGRKKFEAMKEETGMLNSSMMDFEKP